MDGSGTQKDCADHPYIGQRDLQNSRGGAFLFFFFDFLRDSPAESCVLLTRETYFAFFFGFFAGALAACFFTGFGAGLGAGFGGATLDWAALLFSCAFGSGFAGAGGGGAAAAFPFFPFAGR